MKPTFSVSRHSDTHARITYSHCIDAEIGEYINPRAFAVTCRWATLLSNDWYCVPSEFIESLSEEDGVTALQIEQAFDVETSDRLWLIESVKWLLEMAAR